MNLRFALSAKAGARAARLCTGSVSRALAVSLHKKFPVEAGRWSRREACKTGIGGRVYTRVLRDTGKLTNLRPEAAALFDD